MKEILDLLRRLIDLIIGKDIDFPPMQVGGYARLLQSVSSTKVERFGYPSTCSTQFDVAMSRPGSLFRSWEEDPNPSEVAAKLGIPLDKVEDALVCSLDISSLDIYIDEENSVSLGDNVKDDKAPDPYSEAFAQTLNDLLRWIMCSLSQREQVVLQLRYGLNGESPKTLEQTGRALGITRERVRQIQEQALEKIKKRQELSDTLC